MARLKPSPCGRYFALAGTGRAKGGIVNILDAHTSTWLCQARVEGQGGVADFAWWRDGEGLCVMGKGGEVVEYAIAEKRAVARWIDQGGTALTVLALGGTIAAVMKERVGQLGGDRWVAIGSQSGIVNVYDRRDWQRDAMGERPVPVRALGQLVTSISTLLFRPDGQILLMASREKKDALRLGEWFV